MFLVVASRISIFYFIYQCLARRRAAKCHKKPYVWQHSGDTVPNRSRRDRRSAARSKSVLEVEDLPCRGGRIIGVEYMRRTTPRREAIWNQQAKDIGLITNIIAIHQCEPISALSRGLETPPSCATPELLGPEEGSRRAEALAMAPHGTDAEQNPLLPPERRPQGGVPVRARRTLVRESALLPRSTPVRDRTVQDHAVAGGPQRVRRVRAARGGRRPPPVQLGRFSCGLPRRTSTAS